MNHKEFEILFNVQMRICNDTLIEKAREYAVDTDRLHNFNVAAELQNTTRRAALAGMMAKHTVSIYDMCFSMQNFDLDVWDEKITDHINYLILLKAILFEENRQRTE